MEHGLGWSFEDVWVMSGLLAGLLYFTRAGRSHDMDNVTRPQRFLVYYLRPLPTL